MPYDNDPKLHDKPFNPTPQEKKSSSKVLVVALLIALGISLGLSIAIMIQYVLQ